MGVDRGEPIALILGNCIFYDSGLVALYRRERYGVIGFDAGGYVTSLEEIAFHLGLIGADQTRAFGEGPRQTTI